MKYPFYKPAELNKSDLGHYLDGIIARRHYTNNGPLVEELQLKLERRLGVKNLLLVSSGTVALQIACKALQCEGDFYTTPLSFVASSSAFKWLGKKLNYSDIDPRSLNLDPFQLEKRYSSKLNSADVIVATHLYGHACDIDGFKGLQNRFGVKIIYDASHAIASSISGKSILSEGDISAFSLHATKLFHTVEGGGLVFKSRACYERARKMINFGIDQSGVISDIGINAKMSELHAAVGLSGLRTLADDVDKRSQLIDIYKAQLNSAKLSFIEPTDEGYVSSPSYMPIILESKKVRDALYDGLFAEGIGSKKYFEPLLSKSDLFADFQLSLPIAEQFDSRVLCLPLYVDLCPKDVCFICDAIKKLIGQISH